MTSVTIDLPAMYADHHVVEVRRILFEIPGVKAVDASSAFQVVKVEYDPAATAKPTSGTPPPTKPPARRSPSDRRSPRRQGRSGRAREWAPPLRRMIEGEPDHG
jgi:copper chaperone CopZ